MKKAPDATARKENPITRPPPNDSSKRLAAQPSVLAQATFPMLDIRSEWRSTSVPEPPAVKDPKEAAFLKELEEKFGSKEEANRIFALFSAMHQGKSTGTAAIVPQPPIIPDESTAQPPITRSEGAQTSAEEHTQVQPHAEIGPNPDIEE